MNDYLYKSFIVLIGIWLSCINATHKGKGFVENIEIDGGVIVGVNKLGLLNVFAVMVWEYIMR